jgi:hypothetical protein
MNNSLEEVNRLRSAFFEERKGFYDAKSVADSAYIDKLGNMLLEKLKCILSTRNQSESRMREIHDRLEMAKEIAGAEEDKLNKMIKNPSRKS